MLLKLSEFKRLLKLAYFEERKKMHGQEYRYNGRRREGVVYFRKGSEWQRIGKVRRDNRGWYYKSRGYVHGYWPEWWDAAVRLHESWRTSPIRSSTPPPNEPTKVFPNQPGDPDDLDFAMFASKR